MPYIKQVDRELLYETEDPETPGELNYWLTLVIDNYFHKYQNYQAINDIIGALEGAKLEFYRRVAVPYENKKIQENGDVYGV